MSARSIRRAAERKAKKLAAKAGLPSQTVSTTAAEQPLTATVVAGTAFAFAAEPAAEAPKPKPISEAQLAANRANAQLSTGPRSEASKAKVSLNAVKTALTGCTVLLPSDDAEQYREHIAAWERELKPVGIRERHLVQSIADTVWRLNRIPSLELGLYAKGHMEFADKFADRPEPERTSLIHLETLLVYEKQFRNIQLQDARLTRRRVKELAELAALQDERNRAQMRQEFLASRAQAQPAPAPPPPQPPPLPQNGFEFSIPQSAPEGGPPQTQKAAA